MQKPSLSIIIPCYNQSKFIRETLDCLTRQTISDWECIMVDDGSSDDTLKIMKEYSLKDPRYIAISQANGGPASARNNAIRHSHGKYILPLDSDDLIDPSYAEKAIAYLENHPDTKLVYCQAEYFGFKKGAWDLDPYDYEKLLWGNMIFCSAVYRRSDYDKTTGYNEGMRDGNEDWDFWLTLLRKEDKVYQIPKVLFFYRQHSVSRNTNAVSFTMNYNLMSKLIANHKDIYSAHLDEVCDYYVNMLDSCRFSRDFKIGHMILKPYRYIKGMLGYPLSNI